MQYLELQPDRRRTTPSGSSAPASTAGFFDVFGLPAGARPRLHGRRRPARTRAGRRAQPPALGAALRQRSLRRRPAHHARTASPTTCIGVMPAQFDLTAQQRRALGADRLHGGAQGACTTSTTCSLRPAEAGRDATSRRSASCSANAQRLRGAFPRDAPSSDFTIVAGARTISSATTAAAVHAARRRRLRAADRVRQRRQPAAGARRRARRRARHPRGARRRPRPDRPPAADRERRARARLGRRRPRAGGVGHPRAGGRGARRRAAARADDARSVSCWHSRWSSRS